MSVLGIVSGGRPCWVLDLGDCEPHFAGYQAAKRYAAELDDGSSPRRLAECCWTVTCPECDVPYEDAAGGGVHFGTREEAVTDVEAAGWSLAGWSLLCRDCLERLGAAHLDGQVWALPFAAHPDQLALFEAVSGA